jgi:hypothetical protein
VKLSPLKINRVFASEFSLAFLALLTLTLSLIVSGCGVSEAIDSANSIPAKLDDTNKKMDDTIIKMKAIGEKAELAVVGACYKELNDPENGKELAPLPFDLMGCAQLLGENVSTQNVLKMVYLWVKKLNEVKIGVDEPSELQIEAFNHDKDRIYTVASAVCGLLPEAKIAAIIEEQIYGSGRFQDTALQMLMFRADFVRGTLLEQSLFAEPLNNIGKLEEAVKYAGYLDNIARLPFAGEIKLKITGFKKPRKPVHRVLDSSVALRTWIDIRDKAGNDLGEIKVNSTGNPVQDKKALADQVARKEKALATVKKQIESWGGELPAPLASSILN